jgi:hypothetical protein
MVQVFSNKCKALTFEIRANQMTFKIIIKSLAFEIPWSRGFKWLSPSAKCHCSKGKTS